MPIIGNSGQNQEGEEDTDQDAEEHPRIIRFPGLLANLTDQPGDESRNSGNWHRIDARSQQDEYSHISVVDEVFFCDGAYPMRHQDSIASPAKTMKSIMLRSQTLHLFPAICIGVLFAVPPSTRDSDGLD